MARVKVRTKNRAARPRRALRRIPRSSRAARSLKTSDGYMPKTRSSQAKRIGKAAITPPVSYFAGLGKDIWNAYKSNKDYQSLVKRRLLQLQQKTRKKK